MEDRIDNRKLEALAAEDDGDSRSAEFQSLPAAPYNWHGACLSCGCNGLVNIRNICAGCEDQ